MEALIRTACDLCPFHTSCTDPLTIERMHNREWENLYPYRTRHRPDGKTMIVTQENRVRYYNKKFDVSEMDSKPGLHF